MFDIIEQAHLGELHLKSDPASGLKSIIAIHNTKLGPALGGCRCIEYATCLLYTSPSPRDLSTSRMPSSA